MAEDGPDDTTDDSWDATADRADGAESDGTDEWEIAADRYPSDDEFVPTDHRATATRTDEHQGDDADQTHERLGPEPSSAPIEAGEPSLENALFVLLGALASVAVIVRAVSLGLG